MEKVIKKYLKKEKDIEKLKIKIFSKTLNTNHNLKIQDFYILQIQPYICNKNTKEKLALLEECITNKLLENIESYYDINEGKNNLLNIIYEKEIHIYPNYITFEKYIADKMMKYITEKRIIDYNLDIINKIKVQIDLNKKTKKYFDIKEVNDDFTNSMINEGIKINKRQSIKKKKKEKKVFILLKADKYMKDNKYKKVMEKRENLFLINELKQSVNKINAYNYKLKLKSTNIFYNIFDKVIERIKKNSYSFFIKSLKTIKNPLNYERRNSTYQKSVIIPLAKKIKSKIRNNRFSLMEGKSIVPKLINLLGHHMFFNKNKYKFKPVYLFNKKFNKEYNDFNTFFRDWNNKKYRQIINDIYKYTEENFNSNHNILYSQVNKLIKNNKIDNLEKEVSQNKKKINNKRFNTISNFSNKNKKNKFVKTKINNKDKNINSIKDKLLLNLKYQL